MRARLLVREYAKKKGMSRTKLRNKSELTYNVINKVWKNPYAEVTLTTISRMAYALGVQTADLIEDVDDNVYEAEMELIKKGYSPDEEE
jgi:DNA-binding Xre family transcriptional regulator